ncbi:hypothetical protein SELMODRAFT_427126 [Selaginella moellendorffii]|uniref:Uncharacterized protein n=1 Tax=Selaginella moellendorffii TaxID=88036 RepID=D8SYL0_SELML|nr:hypothetical protein SELMODRAFT_427126 [Selaginella moellendorffii]
MADTEIQPVVEIADPEIQLGLRLRNLSLKRICYWVREWLRRAAAVAVSDNLPADAAMQIVTTSRSTCTPILEIEPLVVPGAADITWEVIKYGTKHSFPPADAFVFRLHHQTWQQQRLPLVAANTNLNTELWDVIQILTLWTIYRERIDVLYHRRTQLNDIRAAVSFWSYLLVSLAS